MLIDVVLLIIGFALLIKGADFFVDASVGIANRLKIPKIIIGLTVVALGTSAPEAVVSIIASIEGSNALAIGNVIGSNMFNLLLAIGLCAIIKPFNVNFREISRDFWVSIGAAVILLFVKILSDEYVSRIISILFLLIFALYMGSLIRQALKDREKTDTAVEENAKPPKRLWVNILIAIGGCVAIVIGGQLTVLSAVDIALTIGMTERIVGLTIVAIGTSLPELVTSIVAAKKGESGIALGNVVGSNIFNILFVLGIAGTIYPLVVDGALIQDLIILTIGSLSALFFVYTGRRVARMEGVTMVALYFAYMAFIILS